VNERNKKHAAKKRHVALIGCGGNVGGFAVDHLGRLADVGKVSLCDMDVYEEKNLRSQNIVPADVGRPKAIVQAERLQRINPVLDVEAYVDSVENVPLGCLSDVDVILAAVDTRRARQVINEIARRLNCAWIDSGVERERLLARVTVYFPGREDACGECRMTPEQYAELETSYPCQPDAGAPAPTNAPSSLGALAASLMVLECTKVLAGETRYDGSGYEVFMEADYHNLYPTKLQRNKDCRLSEHQTGAIKPLSGFETRSIDSTLGALLRPDAASGKTKDAAGGKAKDARGSEADTTGDGPAKIDAETPPGQAPRLRVIGQRFVTHLTCSECGHRRAYVKLRVSLKSDGPYKCDRCGGEMIAAGFDTLEALDGANLSRPTAARTLRSVGIRHGDVICLSRPKRKPRYIVTLNGAQGARLKKIG